MKQFLTLLFLAPLAMMAQEISIEAGSYTGCGAFILDSGMNTGDYNANENFAFVVCPEEPETVINLNWVIFDLPNDGDSMTIYDGPDTESPLIGTYTGFELQGQNVFSSESNTTGCLTFVFVSGALGGGNFAVGVSCGEPCFNPFVVVETEFDNPALVCPGQTITFDASATVTGENSEIVSWFWDFGDGETASTEGPVVEHEYANPGGYQINLTVTDDNDCQNNNLADLVLLVSTGPNFNGTSGDVEICLGQEVSITGQVEGVLFAASPDPNLGRGFVIPDDQTQCFDSQITFNGFAPNSTISSIDDFESFYVNMEHSFMGDLVISLICPNGQSMIVHQQGGGGTDLGIPVTGDELNPVAGTGFDYWWAPNATNGTWEQESGFVNTLPSGTYSSVQPWDLLVGCPLNGTWTIEICDLFGIDNGHVFDWGVFFAPELYPELLAFTPTFGAGCDDTFWSGPFVTSNSDDCNTATLQPTELGTFQYTYTAINNHGCEYTTSLEVEVTQGPLAQTDDLVYLCDNAATLNGSISNPDAGTTYTYEWSPAEFVNDPTAANTIAQNINEPTTFVLTVYPDGIPECNSSSEVLVEIPPQPEADDFDPITGCLGQIVDIGAPGQDPNWLFGYEWFNLEGIDPNAVVHDGQTIGVTESGLYQVVISLLEGCDYTASAEVEVTFDLCELGEIPNIFSPGNNDGINDVFRIEGLNFFSPSSLEVYNRWGTLIFQSDDYRNNWSPRREEAAEGTYFYILRVNFPSGIETFTGTLTLVRTPRR
jgi:gliding motility-associated-like protein